MGGELDVDMDDATLAKPAKASARATKTAKAPARPKSGATTNRRGAVAPVKGQFTAIKTQNTYTGRLFGGTNTKTNPKADMAILKGKGSQMYGRVMGTGGIFGEGAGPLFERFGLAPKAQPAPRLSA